jgi:hypothetical protein
MSTKHYYELADTQFCPVCGSTNHIHCSKGCAGCDDPKNPMPRYASTFCSMCGESFCVDCMEAHKCTGRPS